ncbi:MAG: EAL domain-containing protein [Gammaproteobacteria bacterium]|nr:EAL domain-containing protein [Gammaproteobacteria bacterium]MDH5592857.1 EAL domain-containing protein [Gammaproteobacteria bacterium]
MGQKIKSWVEEHIASLEAELHHREREIAILKKISDAVTHNVGLDKIFQMVAEHARDLINAETLLIPVLDENKESYTYRAGCGKNANEIIGESLPLEFGVCGWVWANKKPWWSGVIETLSAEEKIRWKEEAGTVILVPMVGQNSFLGGIAGIKKEDGTEFNERDLNLLSLFAQQISNAIENVTSYEQLTQAKEEAIKYQVELQKLNSQLIDTNKELEHLALYDTLTALPNRTLIQDRIQQGLLNAQRDKEALSVLIIDLDSFKEVNDTLGHDTGDELLKQVGNRFQHSLRHVDTVGRLGGDEFAVIVSNADTDEAVLVANNLLKVLDEPFIVNESNFHISASVGIASYPEHGEDVSTLIKRADVAMYVAKRARCGYFVYDLNEDPNSLGRLTLMGELRKAIDEDSMELYYQPKLDLESGKIVGVEALARWTIPEKGMIPPDFFVPVMEQTGLIKPFTKWALNKAIGQCVAWQKENIDITMSVNLSVYNLRDPEFLHVTSELLKKWKPKPGSIILEITESAIMTDDDFTRNVLSNLSKEGVHFSIDDFGTGYSSLVHLKQLQPSEIKIDKSFVMDMNTNKDDAVIVRSTIDLGHNLGLKVVAEGVETQEVMDSLKELGCEMIQGYHISRPLPVNEITEFLKKSNKTQH